MSSQYPSRSMRKKAKALQVAANEASASRTSFATNHSNQTFHFTAPVSSTTTSEDKPQTIFERLAQNSSNASKQTVPLAALENELQSLNIASSVPKTFNFGKSHPDLLRTAASSNLETSRPIQSTRTPYSPSLAPALRPTPSTTDTETDSDSESDSYSDSSSGGSEQESPAVNRGLQVAMGKSKTAKSAAEEAAAAEETAAAEEARLEEYQLALLNTGYLEQDTQQITGTPIFAHGVLKSHPEVFTQYGFLAGDTAILDDSAKDESTKKLDPRLYFNIAAPSSVFICGSQGSGKSHSLSCLLENCLVKSDVNKLENPLAGLVFHYDTFTSDTKGIPCEAAHLASNKKIKVKVLCSPANVETIKRTYAGMNVQIEPLRIDQRDLDTKRMLDLMAVNPENGPMPLYLHSVNRILREMRIQQQADGIDAHFKYAIFKQKLDSENMTPAQLGPLQQRLDTLESFMHSSQIGMRSAQNVTSKKAEPFKGNDWSLKAGTMTIVDLSCPCVTPEGACALFNICLGIFMGQKEKIGRVIALDEAHKYMGSANEASTLTDALLSAIRLQRHLGTRVLISTQEPTISPKLLDLCSVTIVFRFQSPEWLRCLKAHLAALDDVVDDDGKPNLNAVFQKIVRLRVGEALLFAPSATVNGD